GPCEGPRPSRSWGRPYARAPSWSRAQMTSHVCGNRARGVLDARPARGYVRPVDDRRLDPRNLAVQAGVAGGGQVRAPGRGGPPVDELLRLLNGGGRRANRVRALQLGERIEGLGAVLVAELAGEPARPAVR